MSSQTEKPTKDEVLAGACELGILECAWEHFVDKPAHDYLFVIDAPAMSSVHALPPHNISYFGVTGFLRAPETPARLKGMPQEKRQAHYDSQSKTYPLTVGLTELIARYVFERRWSRGAAKLMMSRQVSTMAPTLDVVERAAGAEFTKTVSNANSNNPLNTLKTKFFASKTQSPEDFIDHVIGQLKDLLPSIYGAYSATRQLLRYNEALPFHAIGNSENKTVFAESIAELRLLLSHASVKQTVAPNAERSATPTPVDFSLIRSKWRESVPDSGNTASHTNRKAVDVTNETADGEAEESADDGTEVENADTLAQIEYVNRALTASGSNVRLVFVTTTARLFHAAIKRFSFDERMPVPKVGTRARYEKALYTSRLLATTGGDAELLTMPMLDPRALMTSPDFVSYANRSAVTSVEDASKAISTWVPFFFRECFGGEKTFNATELFDVYAHLAGKHTTRSPSLRSFDLNKFTDQHRDALIDSWDKYAKIVAAAEGVERIARRDAFHDVRQMLLARDQHATFQSLIAKKLDAEMSRWLSALGGSSLRRLLFRSARGTLKFRIAPPLILPSFNGAHISFHGLVRYLASNPNPVDAMKFAWLGDAKPEIFGVDPNDSLANFKTRYIQMLGHAILFSALDNWDEAYRLTTQAFALAEQFLVAERNRIEPTYVSGREAAYFASIALRRRGTLLFLVGRTVEQGLAWVDKYRAAINKEAEALRNPPDRHAFHLFRIDIERCAWEAYRLLAQTALESHDGERFSSRRPDFNRIQTTVKSLFGRCDGLQVDRFKRSDASDDENTTYQAYARAGVYLRRQLTVIALQLQLLAAYPLDCSDVAKIKALLAQLKRSASDISHGVAAEDVPFSSLDLALVAAAERVVSNGFPPRPYEPAWIDRFDLFEDWRKRSLDAIAENTSPMLG